MEFYRFTYKTKSKTKCTLVFLKDLNLIFNGNVNFKANKPNIFEAFYPLHHCDCSKVGLINQGLENASQDGMLDYLKCECPNKTLD
jgi:hypothetical protein